MEKNWTCGECDVVSGWTWMGNDYVRGCSLIDNGGWMCWSNRETSN